MIERPDGTLSKSTTASPSPAVLSPLLDVERPDAMVAIVSRYPRPGIDRPLVTAVRTSRRWAGFETKIELERDCLPGESGFAAVIEGFRRG